MVADMVGVPLYRRIAADVRARVDRGDLVPGARVETEPELMARYGVSRATVRQAFDADGAVIEYCRSTVRADRHRCSVELRDR